ncbi:unnamed protein product [Caenorhabditis auriculariae]|uniref:DUF8206 domain-containing protein n=1 Tax=Caenorhabditis auriculariae TaxID=2777116 RepID=A0A8S1HWS7_9PELO|nr:unnamed protein product [Caenorhabditis auriculariae]
MTGSFPEFIELADVNVQYTLKTIYSLGVHVSTKMSNLQQLISGQNDRCRAAFQTWRNQIEMNGEPANNRYGRVTPEKTNSYSSSMSLRPTKTDEEKAREVEKLKESAPLSIRRLMRGSSLLEAIRTLKENMTNADPSTWDDFDSWMAKKFPGFTPMERFPSFIANAPGPAKKELIDFYKNENLKMDMKIKCLDEIVKDLSNEVQHDYQIWRLMNSSEFPFLPMVEDLQRRRGAGRTRSLSRRHDEGAPTIVFPKLDLADFFKKLRPTTNILVLGETGVGKSTFINGLVNYLNFEDLEDALHDGHHVLIESSFTQYVKGKEKKVELKATMGESTSSEKSNEVMSAGQSSTQEPKDYIFEYNDVSMQRCIRIIDTPGIGDTRGIEQDKKNFEKILQFLSTVDDLHAILILMKPNSAKLTTVFRFCLDELLVHLHKDASKNIFFCFTNARASRYTPGESLPTIKEHLKKLDQRGIQIPLDGPNGANYYCFDNECFRYLCAKSQGIDFGEKEKEDSEESWRRSVAETQRLFSRIATTHVHEMSQTLCLNNTRNAILALTRPLIEIAKVQMTNERIINEKIEEAQKCETEEERLALNTFVEQVQLKIEESNMPHTVCTAPSCVEYRQLSANSPYMQPVFKRICHDPCYLTGVQAETCPNETLKFCWAMGGCGANCRMCGCPWNTHMHIRYKIIEELVRVEDEDVKKMRIKEGNTKATINMFIEKQKEKLEEYRAEMKKVMTFAAEFSAFLKTNCMLTHNDTYGHEPKTRSCSKRLKQLKEKHDFQVKTITESVKRGSVSTRTPAEIEDMIKELSHLKHSGKQIEDLKNIELLTAKVSSAQTATKVFVKKQQSGRAAQRETPKDSIGSKFLGGWKNIAIEGGKTVLGVATNVLFGNSRPSIPAISSTPNKFDTLASNEETEDTAEVSEAEEVMEVDDPTTSETPSGPIVLTSSSAAEKKDQPKAQEKPKNQQNNRGRNKANKKGKNNRRR